MRPKFAVVSFVEHLDVDIDREDLEIKYEKVPGDLVREKVAVRIRHKSTGITVSNHDHWSILKNKREALRSLRESLLNVKRRRPDNKILCVWNKRYGSWGMPGGLVEEGEEIDSAQRRELKEETGLRTASACEIYRGQSAAQISGRGSMVIVFDVLPISIKAREVEPGCPVTWFTREEFLKWSKFSDFYKPMFESL